MEELRFSALKCCNLLQLRSKANHAVRCAQKTVRTRQPGTASLWWAPMQRRNLRSRTTSGRASELVFFVASVEYDEGTTMTTTMTMTLTVVMTMLMLMLLLMLLLLLLLMLMLMLLLLLLMLMLMMMMMMMMMMTTMMMMMMMMLFPSHGKFHCCEDLHRIEWELEDLLNQAISQQLEKR